MRLLLLTVSVCLCHCTSRTFRCSKGTIYDVGEKPSTQLVKPDSSPSVCYFLVEYNVDSLDECSFHRIAVKVDYEEGTRAVSRAGDCFYGRGFFGSRRYLQCSCHGSACNGQLEKIRPLFDDYRLREDKGNETTAVVELKLLSCIEKELEALSLLPPRPEEPAETDESPTAGFSCPRWLLYLLLGLLLSLVALILVCIAVKKCQSGSYRPEPGDRVRSYERWHIVDPITRGTYIPLAVDSRENVKEHI